MSTIGSPAFVDEVSGRRPSSAPPLSVPALPGPIARARRVGHPWAIRLACVWDTLERYDGVRRRSDRLPAQHLVCDLAADVRRLADDDLLGLRTAWSDIATRLDAACSDPLGDDPATAIRELTDRVIAAADDMID